MNEELWDLDDSLAFLSSRDVEDPFDGEEFEDDQLSPSEPMPSDEPFDWFHEREKEYDV